MNNCKSNLMHLFATAFILALTIRGTAHVHSAERVAAMPIQPTAESSASILKIPDSPDFHTWLADVRRLAAADSAEASALLKDAYASLPDGHASSDAAQRRKCALVRILAGRMDGMRKEKFLTEILQKEIALIRRLR